MRKTTLPALLLPAALAGLLPGCQTWGPTWSEVTGARYVGGILYRRPAIVEHIDNQGAFASDPIRTDPGPHRIQLSAPLPGWPGGSDIKVMELTLEPCKRYYFNAQFDNNVSPNWKPVIDYVEPIAGCTVPK